MCVRFFTLVKTDVCRCAEVVLIASVVFVDDLVFYSDVDSAFPSVVVFCYLLSSG